MAKSRTLAFTGVEAIEGNRSGDIQFASPGWRVTFEVRIPHVGYEVAILVEPNCPKEDIVRRAMHLFHLQMSELAEETADWRLTQAETDRRSAPPSVPG